MKIVIPALVIMLFFGCSSHKGAKMNTPTSVSYGKVLQASPTEIKGVFSSKTAVSYLMDRRSETDAFVETTISFLKAERERLTETFADAKGIKFFPSTVSFVLARLLNTRTADEICDDLSQDKILIRNCANFRGLSEHFIRISLKKREANTILMKKFSGWI